MSKHNKQNSNVSTAPAPVSAMLAAAEAAAEAPTMPVALETTMPVAKPEAKGDTVVDARSVDALMREIAFDGERAHVTGKVSLKEAARVAVHLDNQASVAKGRAAFLLAEKARECKTEEEAKVFKTTVAAEMSLSAKESAVRICQMRGTTDEKSLTAAKDSAEAEAKQKFDNLFQSVRAARWMLENPDKVAKGTSVFTVQQANRFLELPEEGAVKRQETLAIREKVLPLLAKEGVSQGDVKKAVKEVKDALKAEEEKKEKEAAVTPEARQKAQDAMCVRLPIRVLSIVDDINKMAADGAKPEDWRGAKLTNALLDLCRLAGVEVTTVKVEPTEAK